MFYIPWESTEMHYVYGFSYENVRVNASGYKITCFVQNRYPDQTCCMALVSCRKFKDVGMITMKVKW